MTVYNVRRSDSVETYLGPIYLDEENTVPKKGAQVRTFTF